MHSQVGLDELMAGEARREGVVLRRVADVAEHLSGCRGSIPSTEILPRDGFSNPP